MAKPAYFYNKVISVICIAAAVLITGLILNALPPKQSSVETPAAIVEYIEEQPPLYPVTFINSSNIGVTEQDVNQLRGNNPKKLKDKFNIKLSHNNFFYTDSIDVEITTDIPDAKIFYSLDGNTPMPQKGREYIKPIRLMKGSYNTSYVLKIIAYTDDDESHLLTHTYFISEQIDSRFTTLVFSISSDNNNLYDHENGILVEGKLREEYIQRHDFNQRDIHPPDPANYNLRGREGEREAYIEVFTPEGECVISQNAGIRVHGAWSRAANKKSLRLYARGEYDPDFGKFNYAFFSGARRKDEYQSFITSYGSLLLRNGANDREGSFMREELCQAMAKDAGFLDYKNFAPAAVFVNGEYYGFFWLQHTYNDAYFLDNYGGDSKGLIKIGEWEEPNPGDLTVEANFIAYSKIIDIDNYMLYYAFEIYSGNRDWPHNNLKYWRFDGDGRYINKYFDGKYRMLLYDVEMSWGMYGQGYRERTIQRILRDGSSRSFAAFMRRGDVVEKFCNQMFDLLNTVFVYEAVEKNFNAVANAYEEELSVAIRARAINDWIKMNNIRNEHRSILRFAEGRRDIIVDDMISTFRLEYSDIYYVTANGSENSKITLNTLKADGATQLKSCYFEQHTAVLKSEPYVGYSFDYWEINGQKYSDAEITLNAGFAVNGQINATLHIKSDEAYKTPVIKTIRLDDNFDYIELSNPGNNEFTVNNLYLSNDKNDLKKFEIAYIKFPQKSSAGYYGSNYEGSEADDTNIFDFKIQKGETIYLSDSDGNIIQELATTKNITENEIIRWLPDGSYKIFKAEEVR